MASTLAQLDRELERRRIPHEIKSQFNDFGDRAFEHLLSVARKEGDSWRVKANCLNLLAYLAGESCRGRENEVIGLAIGFTSDSDVRVRTEAVNAAMAMVHLGQHVPWAHVPPTRRSEVAEAVQQALSLGLMSDDHEKYARDFIAGKV